MVTWMDCHGDLDGLHMVALEQGSEHAVCEAQVQQVLHRLLAEVIVDPEHACF